MQTFPCYVRKRLRVKTQAIQGFIRITVLTYTCGGIYRTPHTIGSVMVTFPGKRSGDVCIIPKIKLESTLLKCYTR